VNPLPSLSGRQWRPTLLSLSLLSSGALLPAASVTVTAGSNLQAAFNQARSGDIITLAAGATFTGHYTLAPNSGATITIQSSGAANLPAGQRVSPGQANQMAKLVTPDNNQVLRIPSGANNYKIAGIEFTENPGVYVEDLVQAASGGETSAGQLPHDLGFDRCYIHGNPQSGGKRGLALNSGKATIENSYFADFISDWQDTQAIAGWNGTGPYLIQNNHLESGTEIVAFGGAPTSMIGVVPSNITIQNNEFFKPTRYYAGASDYAGFRVWAKNHIELKNAQHVLIQNNTFTNNFEQADQLGFAMVFSVRDEGGQVAWATINDVTVQNNVFDHTGDGVLFMGHDGDGGGSAGNFTLRNNLWTHMGEFGGDGRMYEILNDVRGITIDHDTAFPTGWLMVFAQGASSGVRVTNSIYNSAGNIAADGGIQSERALAAYDPDGAFTNNALIGGTPSYYTGAHFANNVFPASLAAVQFAPGSYSLASSSPYRGLATDGADLGDTQLTGGTTAPPPPGIPTGWTQILSKNSGKCMDVEFVSQAPSARLHQWSCWGGDNQKFLFTPVAGGYKITVKHSGQVLDIAGGPGATQDGAWLTQYPYWAGTNEIFQVNQTPDGFVTINPISSGKCLDVEGISKAEGAYIHQWSCWGGDNQKWSFVP
jgi:hypothetical protein